MGFRKKFDFFFKYAKGGKIVVECVTNSICKNYWGVLLFEYGFQSFTSWKTLIYFLVAIFSAWCEEENTVEALKN